MAVTRTSPVRRRREEQELSRSELAQAAGVSDLTIHRIESGEVTPHMATRRKIAEALGVRVVDLWPVEEARA